MFLQGSVTGDKNSEVTKKQKPMVLITLKLNNGFITDTFLRLLFRKKTTLKKKFGASGKAS
jgi:hypothetical protein